ncbi:uncharacterized protein TNCV_1445301 [Trichonephila clavipes]|nr:uncharacterized protein TNCV_1445301 [Trichonephila clavipes]
MSKLSPFNINEALNGICERKSVQRLHSGDLLIETKSAVQTKSFLLAKSFVISPVTISPHKMLNYSLGVSSEPDLLTTPEAEIFEGFSTRGGIQTNTVGFPPACLPCVASRKEENGALGILCVSFGPRFTVDGVSAADKVCRVYPLDPCPDAVALYSGGTPGKRRAWCLPDDRHTASLVGLRSGVPPPTTKSCTCFYGSYAAVTG